MKNLNVHLSDELHTRLKLACVQEQKDMSEVIRKLIEEYVGKAEKKRLKK
jgi:metal-responsive CopG/Arc/MetJ family transcriptional regulator